MASSLYEPSAYEQIRALDKRQPLVTTVGTYTTGESWTPSNVSQCYTPAMAFNAATLTGTTTGR